MYNDSEIFQNVKQALNNELRPYDGSEINEAILARKEAEKKYHKFTNKDE